MPLVGSAARVVVTLLIFTATTLGHHLDVVGRSGPAHERSLRAEEFWPLSVEVLASSASTIA